MCGSSSFAPVEACIMKNHVNAAAVEQILHVSAPTVCSRWTSTAERERLVSLSLMVVHAAGVVPAVGCCPRSSGACGSTCAALQKDASKFLWTVLGTSVSFWDRSKALSARTVVVTRSLLSVNTARERAARRWVVPSKSVLWKQARPLLVSLGSRESFTPPSQSPEALGSNFGLGTM